MRALRTIPPGVGSGSVDAVAVSAGVADRVDAQLMDDFLDVGIAEIEDRHFHRGNPALFTGEAIFGVLSLVTGRFAPARHRLRDAAARMLAIPTFLDGGRRSIGAHPIPAPWIERALRECEGGRCFLDRGMPAWIQDCVEGGSPHDSDNRGDGDDRDGAMARPAELAALAGRACGAAREALAAIDGFARWLTHDVAATTNGRYGCGGALFDRLLARGHREPRSRPELLRQARSYFDDARAAFDEQISRSTTGGWPAICTTLADRHPSMGDYVAAHTRTWEACRTLADEAALLTWPEAPVRYGFIPRCAREAAPHLYYLLYRSPAPHDRCPVHEAVLPAIDRAMATDRQTALLRANNFSVIKLNHVVHHGAIGHHVQNARAADAPSRIGRVAAVDGASRIGMFSAGTLAEGWACYATDLMEEIGFLSNLEHIAQQHTRLRLLARAIVDLELHQGSMTLDEAEEWYRNRVDMPPAAAHAEATKNSMFPGTAIMYWIGSDGIHRLRDERQRVEGAGFSLRRFHDRLLGYGAIPVSVIAELFEREPFVDDAKKKVEP